MPTILNKGLDFYVNKIRLEQPFTFVRFGNGEWSCIYQRASRTGSGSQSLTDPELQQKLAFAAGFHNAYYLRGLQSPGYLKQAALWLIISRFLVDGAWYAGDVFHRASAAGNLFPFVEILRTKRVGIIGPKWLRKLDEVIGYEWFVQVPEVDCFGDYYSIRSRIIRKPRVEVYLFSCGPTAKVLEWELHPCLEGEAWLLDMGSLWDIYCGIESRGYHRRFTKEIIECNLGLRSS